VPAGHLRAAALAAIQAQTGAANGALRLVRLVPAGAGDRWGAAARRDLAGLGAEERCARPRGAHGGGMKTYRVAVEGQTYEVTVEEVPPALAPAPRVRQPKAVPAARGRPGKAHRVLAPMPGKVLAVKVLPGDRVAAGSALLVLEAMKMENDVLSPVDGTVKAVGAAPGASVGAGDLLLVIE